MIKRPYDTGNKWPYVTTNKCLYDRGLFLSLVFIFSLKSAFPALLFKLCNADVISPDGVIKKPKYLYYYFYISVPIFENSSY